MSRNYSRNTFLGQTPNKILKKYSARKGLPAGVDFDSLWEAETEPIVETLDVLGDEQRKEAKAKSRLVNEMPCDAGAQLLVEEAGQNQMAGHEGGCHPAREIDMGPTVAKIPKETKEGKLDFHVLRMCFVTLAVEAGANNREAQMLTRHSTPELTANVYARGMPGRQN